VIFGFLLSVAYVPGWWGGATTPRWAIATLIVAAMVPFKAPRLNAAHLFGALFLAWAALSLSWSANVDDGLDGLIKLAIMAGAFLVGSSDERDDMLERFTIGAALGLSVSSVLAVAQNFEWIDLAKVGNYSAGLFLNANLMAEAAAMLLVACAIYRRWVLAAAVAPAFLLPQCRGAMIAVAVCWFAWQWGRSKKIAIGVAAMGLAVGSLLYLDRIATIGQRLTMWSDTIPQISLFGSGLGSFYTMYPYFGSGWDSFLMRPEHAHNDLIEIAFETGIIGAVLAVLFVAFLAMVSLNGFRHGRKPDGWIGLIGLCFLVESCFEFPLHVAFTAVYAALIAGALARDGYDLRVSYLPRRAGISDRNAAGEHDRGADRAAAGLGDRLSV
jgi:O-antigen ligase